MTSKILALSLGLCLVAGDVFDAAVSVSTLHEWDLAAGDLLAVASTQRTDGWIPVRKGAGAADQPLAYEASSLALRYAPQVGVGHLALRLLKLHLLEPVLQSCIFTLHLQLSALGVGFQQIRNLGPGNAVINRGIDGHHAAPATEAAIFPSCIRLLKLFTPTLPRAIYADPRALPMSTRLLPACAA